MIDSRLYHLANLAHVHFYDHSVTGFIAIPTHDIRRKRPEGLEFQQSNLFSPFSKALHNVERGPGRRSERNQNGIRIFQVKSFIHGNMTCIVLDLVHQVA